MNPLTSMEKLSPPPLMSFPAQDKPGEGTFDARYRRERTGEQREGRREEEGWGGE